MDIAIFDSDLIYCKQLINAVSLLKSSIRFSYIVNCLNDIFRIGDPDIILANYEFFGKGLEREFPSAKFIYMSETIKADGIISRTDIDFIIKTLENLIDTTHADDIEKLIYGELIYLGYDLTHLGTKCIFEVIKLMYYSEDENFDKSFLGYFYPHVATSLGISASSVKSSIVYATDRMFINCDRTKLAKYFSSYENKKPSIRTIIFTIVDNVRLKDTTLSV